MAVTDVFGQQDYNAITRALDDAVDIMKSKGKSEAEAQEWLKDFVAGHYCKVWRGLLTYGQRAPKP